MSTTDLAERLASDGFAGREGAVRAVVVDAARARRVSPALVDVLADPGQPEVARLRAFGRVAAALARPPVLAVAPPTRRAA